MIFSHLAPKKHKISKIGCVAREGQAWANLVFCCCYCWSLLRFVVVIVDLLLCCCAARKGLTWIRLIFKFWSHHLHHPRLCHRYHHHHRSDRHCQENRTWTLNTPGALRMSGMVLPPSATHIIYYFLGFMFCICNIHHICSAIGLHVQKDTYVKNLSFPNQNTFTFISRPRT